MNIFATGRNLLAGLSLVALALMAGVPASAQHGAVSEVLLEEDDVLAAFDFDVAHFRRGVEILNPGVTFFPLSCKTGKGLEAWLEWLGERVREYQDSLQT